MASTPPPLLDHREKKVSFNKEAAAMWEEGYPQLLPSGDFACYGANKNDDKPGILGERASTLKKKKNQSFDSVISVPLFLKNEADLMENDSRNMSRDSLIASPFCSRLVSRMSSPSSLLSPTSSSLLSPHVTWGGHERHHRAPSFDLSVSINRHTGSSSSHHAERGEISLEQRPGKAGKAASSIGHDERGRAGAPARLCLARARPLRREGTIIARTEKAPATHKSRKRPRPSATVAVTPKRSSPCPSNGMGSSPRACPSNGMGSSPPLKPSSPAQHYSQTHPHFIEEGRWKSMRRKVRRSLRVGEWAFNCSSGELWWSRQSRRILGVSGRRNKRNPFIVYPAKALEQQQQQQQQQPFSSFEEFAKRVHPADRKCVVSLFRRAISKGVPFDVSHRLLPLPKPSITVFGAETDDNGSARKAGERRG
eukprot:CAMPEP_0185251384 /NCGR_PEP_ID=MMETSP1359-20130426/797_1 /TAXON_ID=552665 /ORGANISM="Bigelowiella longifila, Strain CCMP242" /LENGTH=423 /DNA_ID=CAMNT_0027833261 /DNA_START=58 /DNA_END=1325 /DNA_ORIENTATION=-